MDLHHYLFVETNPIPVKWALHRLGWMSDEIRMPLTVLSSSLHEPFEAILKQMNLY
jgi:4-hydroxy-tetrahydrodipicolinate synthase